MNTKKKISLRFSLAMIVVTGMLFVSAHACESHEQRAEEAFEQVKDDMTANGDSNAYADVEPIGAPQKSKTTKVYVPPMTEEVKFNKETESQLNANEALIKDLKGMPNNGKIMKKISLVEKDNAELRVEMAAYLAEVKLRWETYQATTKEELEKISADLKTLKNEVSQ
jgi:hypothetical protein